MRKADRCVASGKATLVTELRRKVKHFYESAKKSVFHLSAKVINSVSPGKILFILTHAPGFRLVTELSNRFCQSCTRNIPQVCRELRGW